MQLGFFPLPERLCWPWAAFTQREKVVNDGGVQPAHTHRSPPRMLSHRSGTSSCEDGGGIFCVCRFALAWPLPACEGCLTPKEVAAGPRSIPGRGLARNNHPPQARSRSTAVRGPACKRNLPARAPAHSLRLSPLELARAKPATALRPPPASKSSSPAGENPEHTCLEIPFARAGQPRAGRRHGVRCENQPGRAAHQRKRGERKPHWVPNALAGPGRAGPLPGPFRCLRRARTDGVLRGFEDSPASASPSSPSSGHRCPLPPRRQHTGRRARTAPARPFQQERGRASAGPRAARAEPAPPPGQRGPAAARRSAGFPFFLSRPSCLPTCRSGARRLTRFFQSPRLVLGTRGTGLRQLLPRQAGQAAAPPATGENNKKYQICRRNAGATVAGGGLVSPGRICSRLGRRPEGATRTALSSGRGDPGVPNGGGPAPAEAPDARWQPDTAARPCERLPGAERLGGGPVINRICGSCWRKAGSHRCGTARVFYS